MTAKDSAAGKKVRASSDTRGRLKTAAILLLVFGGNLLLLALGSQYIVLDAFDRLEQQRKRHHLEQFQAFLDNEIEQLDRIAGDYAGWDAAYDFVQRGDREFIKVNLDDAIFPRLRLNLFLYADNAGNVRYAKAFDYRNRHEVPFPAALLARLQVDRRFFPATAESRFSGILALPEGLLMIAARPVVRSDYSGPVRGVALVGRLLDGEEVARLAAILQTKLAVFREDDAGLPDEIRTKLPPASAGGDGQLSVDGVAGYFLLPDLSGEKHFILQAEEERLFYRQGAKVVDFFLLWAAAISITAGGVIFLLLNRIYAGEQRLRQQHTLLDGIIGSSEDLIVAVDADLRYLIFNRAYAEEFRRLFGVEARLGGAVGAALAHVPPQGSGLKALWERAVAGEAFTTVGDYGRDEHRRTFEMKFTPLRDGEGAVVAAACIARDVTARLREERALRESEQRFRVFFNNVAVGTIQLDAQGFFTRVNDRFCRMTGYSREELLQRTPEDLEHPEDKSRETLREFLAGEESVYRAKKRYIRKDGEIVWVEIAAGPVRDERGYPVRTVGVVQEISGRKRLEEELRTASQAAEAATQAKSEFLATMSHEIRTPMTIFLVALEHLLEIDQDPARRQFLEMADGAARRLRVLIDDILDFSRIEAGRLEIDEQPFALRETVGEVIDLLMLSAQAKGLQLEMKVASEVPPTLVGDPDRLEQVLINLIGNAIKFTEKGGVLVTIETSGEFLHFSVLDSGIGIPDGKSDMLFRQFSQVDGSLTRRHGGTGLGLAICKGLIELMGGRIGFRNRAEGGSIFYFTLPLVVAPAVTRGREAGEGKLMSPLSTGRILLAEDEPTVRTMIQMLLQQNGWQIDTAENGEEAVSRWREERYALIFMDVQMPRTDGLEAVRQIRRQEALEGGHTCVIGLTAHADREMERNCLDAGMDSYITKPVRMGELFAAVECCFSGEITAQRRALGE